MASVLKRKRVPVEVTDGPKRAKPSDSQIGDNPLQAVGREVGWEAAFNPSKELIHTNGVNGHVGGPADRMMSPESISFEDIEPKHTDIDGLEASSNVGANNFSHHDDLEPKTTERHSKSKARKKRAAPKTVTQASWKLSQAIGGRMVNADPVFTSDERYLVVAKRATVLVYASATSLLTRAIQLSVKINTRDPARIVAYSLSPTNTNLLWVACSDGTVFCVDWTNGAGAEAYWMISSTGCVHMTVASMESGKRRRDVVFTTEVRKDGGFRITANELHSPESSFKTDARTIYTSHTRIQFLKIVPGGAVIVGASENKVLVGRLRSADFDSIDKIRYEFRVFESKDPVRSLDARVVARPQSKESKKNVVNRLPVVDVVVGDIRGSIFVHDDLAGKLFSLKDGSASGLNLVPRKLHWHRKAVHTVKWSLDGNYIISGGTETVLVLWQLDTGKQQYLPHMAATIQSVVVSPSGSSYALQMSDNSAMIISTADLKVKTHIAGLQASAIVREAPLESQILRVEETAWSAPLIQRVPAVINPVKSSNLLLAVGQTQEVTPEKSFVLSNPYLQTFDLGSSHSIATQALTRTNVTNTNAAPNAHRIDEPRVIHMKISANGHWLATVDEWLPPKRDFEYQSEPGNSEYQQVQNRREVYLKFWQWNESGNVWELVSRIDAPHLIDTCSTGAGKVLDLATDPSSLKFATLGTDNIVRTWGPKSRRENGNIVKGPNNNTLVNWCCVRAVTVEKSELRDEDYRASADTDTGCVSFSEDGSVLAAALGGTEIVYLIDPNSGAVRGSKTGLLENGVYGLEFLGSDLIILSDRLVVFDVVRDDIKVAIKIQHRTQRLFPDQKNQMIHLAVDHRSRTFAIALPIIPLRHNLYSSSSELIVFQQDGPNPQFTQHFSSLISGLVAATSSEGYLVLDAAAEIHSVVRKGSQSITTLAQSTSALQLDTIPDHEPEAVADLMELASDVEEVEEYEPITPDATQDGNEDEDDDEHPVVTRQQLAEVFDIGPAFALPTMEEMFYQVVDLVGNKPLPVRVKE